MSWFQKIVRKAILVEVLLAFLCIVAGHEIVGLFIVASAGIDALVFLKAGQR